MRTMKKSLLLFITLFSLFIMRSQFPKNDVFIKDFYPLRTVIKVHKDIPIIAIVQNDKDISVDITAHLTLPSGSEVVEGNINPQILVTAGDTSLLRWTVRFDTTGNFPITLKISGPFYAEKSITLHVTDKYWRQTRFLLSAYNPPYCCQGPPYLDTVFTYYKNANFDILLWVRDDDSLIHMVHKYHFKYLLDVGDMLGEDVLLGSENASPPDITEAQLRQLDSLIDKYKNDALLIGYYLCDEPFPSGFPNIAKVIARIRQRDPQRMSFVNLWPYFEGEIGDDGYIENFIRMTKPEILSYDRYNFYNDGDDNIAYLKQIRRMRKFALLYDLPFCNIVQAVGTNGVETGEDISWRTPTHAEHRWLVYTSLTYGVHGLIWFHWDHPWGVTHNPDRDTVYPSIQSLNAEIDSLKEIMLRLTSTAVYHSDDTSLNTADTPRIVIQADDFASLIIGTFRDTTGSEKYYMIMNKDYKNPVETQIFINYKLSSLQTFNVQNNSWEEVPFENNSYGSIYNLRLEPGSGKLFKISGERTQPIHGQGLLNNYPNPFSTNTIIKYSVPIYDENGSIDLQTLRYVEIDVYDLNGRKITTLIKGMQAPGDYQITFNAQGLQNGVYLCHYITDGYTQTIRLVVLR